MLERGEALYDKGNQLMDDSNNQDVTQAIYQYTKSAEQGFARAQFKLGLMYYKGKDITRDYEKAVYWLTKAASQGDKFAQFVLGICYYNGHGVNQDYATAIAWQTKASEQNLASAQYILGTYYIQGLENSPRDISKGIYLIQSAADLGDVNAIEWLIKLAKQHEFCACNLSARYFIGIGVERNHELSSEWLTIYTEWLKKEVASYDISHLGANNKLFVLFNEILLHAQLLDIEKQDMAAIVQSVVVSYCARRMTTGANNMLLILIKQTRDELSKENENLRQLSFTRESLSIFKRRERKLIDYRRIPDLASKIENLESRLDKLSHDIDELKLDLEASKKLYNAEEKMAEEKLLDMLNVLRERQHQAERLRIAEEKRLAAEEKARHEAILVDKATKQDIEAQRELAWWYKEEQQKYDLFLKWLSSAADNGNIVAENELRLWKLMNDKYKDALENKIESLKWECESAQRSKEYIRNSEDEARQHYINYYSSLGDRYRDIIVAWDEFEAPNYARRINDESKKIYSANSKISSFEYVLRNSSKYWPNRNDISSLSSNGIGAVPSDSDIDSYVKSKVARI